MGGRLDETPNPFRETNLKRFSSTTFDNSSGLIGSILYLDFLQQYDSYSNPGCYQYRTGATPLWSRQNFVLFSH